MVETCGAEQREQAVRRARSLRSELVKLDKTFPNDTRVIMGTILVTGRRYPEPEQHHDRGGAPSHWHSESESGCQW